MMVNTFILIFLAISNVYADLTSYSAARGEFLVQSGLAQGYVRYKDENGAERLIAYLYPEPLFSIRPIQSISYDGSLKGTTLLQPQYEYIEAKSHVVDPTLEDMSQLREQNFRAWCEQRFKSLKLKTDKLLAVGLKPSSDMLTQLNYLQSIMAADNETPEVKRAREEHFRLWNEARLKVLQLEAEQLKLQGKPAQAQSTYTESQTVLNDQFMPIQETHEKQKARDEHFKLYNDQLLRIKQHEQDNSKTLHQKSEQIFTNTTYNDFKTILPNTQGVQGSVSIVQETPDITRVGEEYLKTNLYTNEEPLLANVHYLAPKIKEPLDARDDVPRIQEEQRLLAIKEFREIERTKKEENRFLKEERLKEVERIREEEKMRELERLIEIERRKIEQNIMETERLRIQLKDDRRAELDQKNSAEQDKTHVTEKIHLQKDSNYQTQIQLQDNKPLVSQSQIANVAIFSNKHESNPLLLRIANQPEKHSLSSKTLTYYTSNGIANLIKGQNPFLIRYILQNSSQKKFIKSDGDFNSLTTLKPAFDVNKFNLKLKPIAVSDVTKNAGVITDSKNNHKKDTADLSALEQAKFDHFRAHEIALDQLRLAHTKHPDSKRDC